MAKKAKKRTTAQRRAAAKAAWELRRLREAKAPTPTAKASEPAIEVAQADQTVVYVHPPAIAYAVREGSDIYACFGVDGSLNRQRLSESNARKLLRELTAILV